MNRAEVMLTTISEAAKRGEQEGRRVRETLAAAHALLGDLFSRPPTEADWAVLMTVYHLAGRGTKDAVVGAVFHASSLPVAGTAEPPKPQSRLADPFKSGAPITMDAFDIHGNTPCHIVSHTSGVEAADD